MIIRQIINFLRPRKQFKVLIIQVLLASPKRITNTKSYKQNFGATHSDPFLFLVFA